jgi:ATP-dependent 26S proteasome regulatory subunit
VQAATGPLAATDGDDLRSRLEDAEREVCRLRARLEESESERRRLSRVLAKVHELSCVLHVIDEVALFIDATTELTSQTASEGFRVSNARQNAVALYVLDEEVDSLESLLVLRLPVQVVCPGIVGPDLFTHRHPR